MNDGQETYRVQVRRPRNTEWWLQAESWAVEQPDRVPEAARMLLGGKVRTGVLSREAATSFRDWAKKVPGWEDEKGIELWSLRSQKPVAWDDL